VALLCYTSSTLNPLEERRRISRLTFLYKVLHELVAVSPDHLDLILADRPVRGTVTKQRLKILRSSTTQFQKSFVPRTITQWNTLPDSITSAASVSAFRSQPSSVTHLVAVISLWRLVTTFQIQIQTERENSEIADRQTDRETDYTIEIMMLRPSCCWTRTSVTVHSQECHRLPDLELAYRSTALGLTSNSSQPRHLWKPTSLGIWLTDTWLHRKHL